jgi:hypothetical protein
MVLKTVFKKYEARVSWNCYIRIPIPRGPEIIEEWRRYFAEEEPC